MFQRLWRRKESSDRRQPVADDQALPAASPLPAPNPIELAYWLVLWRAPSDADIRDGMETLQSAQGLHHLYLRLLASTEFRRLAFALWDGLDPRRSLKTVETALAKFGDDSEFVEYAYRVLLGRPADPSGHAAYLSMLTEGHWRALLLQILMRSDEFKARFAKVCPQASFIPRDVQLCELANPAKWNNPEWMDLLTSLAVVPPDRPSMHRKGYEFTQLLFGLTRLGFIRDDVRVLSVGAGHEAVLYWLANRVKRVIATDMYAGVWQEAGAREGDASVLSDAARFAPFPYEKDRLIFLQMDGRFLAFEDASFDVVYSLSSIEHFDGFRGARLAMDEMARVLKPGGTLALATDYLLSGPPHHEAFQPEQVHDLLRHPALSLVQPIDEGVWHRYECAPVDIRRNPYQTPNMVVTDEGSVFTSVMAFLRKAH
jgi:SAM-dependent methyltransferase